MTLSLNDRSFTQIRLHRFVYSRRVSISSVQSLRQCSAMESGSSSGVSSDSVCSVTDESDSVRFGAIPCDSEPTRFSSSSETLKEESSPSRLASRGSLKIRLLALSASISPSVMDRSLRAGIPPAATTASSFMASSRRSLSSLFTSRKLGLAAGSWDQQRQMSAA